jgi:dTDP-4-dehydrorhamnose reductase
MKIIITGAAGQLAQDLVRTASPDDRIYALPKDELDITRIDQIQRVIKKIQPDRVINTAGYTRVDQAEQEQEQAFAANRDGPRQLAEVLAGTETRLIHYSTDYVFNGEKHVPYTTTDTPGPLNVYGASKLAGERAVINALGKEAIIIRTAWLYSNHGINFVTRMLQLMQTRGTLQVVSDQIGTPTWTRSLAAATWQLIRIPGLHGIHHFCDAGQTNWFEFASTILEIALQHNLTTKHPAILPVQSVDYNSTAKRPPYSVLDCRQTWRLLGHEPDEWKVSLGKLLAEKSR